MLIYTGFRLGHPSEFVHDYRVGKEQLVIFVVTLVAVLATDLLIGIAIGILVKLIIHVANGAPMNSLFQLDLEFNETADTCRLRVLQSLVFSNWILFRTQVEKRGLTQRKNVVLDLSETKLVDHSVMQKLQELQYDFRQEGLELSIVGLDTHQPLAPHQHAARRRGLAAVRLLTVVAAPSLEGRLERDFVRLGATGYTCFPCTGAGRRQVAESAGESFPRVLIEVVVPWDDCEDILDYLRREILPQHRILARVQTVDVVRLDNFFASDNGSSDQAPNDETDAPKKNESQPPSG